MAEPARRDTATDAVAPGLHASANVYCDASDRTFARMVALAERFVLPNGAAWLVGRGTDKVHGYDAMFTNELPERTYARVGNIASEAEARGIVKGFGLSREIMDGEDYDPSGFLDMFYKTRAPHHDAYDASQTVAVWARRSRSKIPEGFLLCRRDLSVCRTERGGMVLRYRLDGEYAYVMPKARGRGLAGAMAIAVGDQVNLDVQAIRGVVNALPARGRPKLEAVVSGEPHSEGGEWILASLVESMEASFYLAGFPQVECDADFSL